MSEQHAHRWFQFSIRGLFVMLSLAAIGVAWPMSKVWQRERLMEQVGAMDNAVVWRYKPDRFPVLPRPPWYVRLVGGYAVYKIVLPEEEFSEHDRRRIQDAFPEAEVEFGQWPNS